MNAVETIRITDLINPVFYSFWLNEKPNAILKGGRSSMKSSVISLKLVTDFINDPNGNVVVLRKVAKYLSTSVYEQIKWAIYMLKLEDEFYFGKSPLIIRHKSTGTAFYFYGCDDPMKIKSAKIAKGYVMALWFEELAEFDGVEDIDIVADTFIRQDLGDKEVKIYYSYNPPRNPYDWVNEWVDSKRNDPDYFIHHSTYLDDEKGFLSAQLIRKIENYKKTDEEYYRWMYLGEVIGLGDMVYNMNHFHWIDALPEDDDLLLIDLAVDSGYQTSATAFLGLGLTKKLNVILLDTYYYSPANKTVKKAPSDFSEDLWRFEQLLAKTYKVPIDNRTIDSAEGALRNQYFKDYGIRLHPIAKKKKVNMIENVQDLLAQGRFFMLRNENNQIFYEEHKRYQWDPETLNSDDPKVIKENDHTVDAFMYYVNDNLQKLNLKY
ncbi:PBSX family phage terminase large subunit [Parageobacillus thermoglucosidasius]|uniref:PBSX family phage terminase large subunit n=1 Tax=Parageobacillus thermoglucosidasius TaxID=1426 RepID=UPI000E14D736|nr:PBSX family phage terminase large subunit [Parageobacillus thermoglucosidasius]MED4904113.1 PBSX family phage terminase large subunit [Parageobacillus thermoglucosidasius]MED4915663.1 PBSX family phage terminase large subunit [Parageobacillus thermoglucosidasius]MED4945072.1 PBSX family phage terminase large subunit [Parageobacillus thermoglucosidasius]MED4983731.1 PBSX family phage terminase large subunit [Parageobacillus thermoglucosidasius]RDE19327.1 PBSX family phage terminase large sub